MTIYAFGPFVLDPGERRLTRDGRRMAVPDKAWQILQLLVEAGGRLVPHEAFRAKLWPNVVVEDRTLTVHMSTLRKALGADPAADCIETVARAGYRLAVQVRILSAADPPSRAVSRSPVAEAKPLAVRTFSTDDLAEADAYLGVGIADAVTTTLWGSQASQCRRLVPWTISPWPRRSGWAICWRARCNAAPNSCMSRHA